MDALLGLRGELRDGDASLACTTIEGAQRGLHDFIARKSSGNRVEHVSLTCEFRHSTTFHVVDDAEGEPELDPVHTLAEPPAPTTRPVSAYDAIQKQGPDGAALQKAVAEHIAGALGAVDGSAWGIQQTSPGRQSMEIAFLCMASLSVWNQQHSKSADRQPIGAFSNNGGLDDPTNLSRPAFDCRGSLKVIFSKTSRSVVVKYNHMPLHQTVGQVMDSIPPVVPPAPVVNNAGPNMDKPQKAKKAKRPAATDTDGEPTPRKKNKRKSKAREEAERGDENGADDTQNGTEEQNAGRATSETALALNIAPGEMKRRREVAIRRLTERQIDPETLSEEQMNIFSNQAPQLQEVSLEMFVLYGAERLRIVHPQEKEQPSSAPAPATTTKSVLAAAAPSEEPSESSHPEAGHTENRDVMAVDAITTQPKSTSKPKVTRGACDNCKRRKVKCDKAQPICARCADAHQDCHYAPAKTLGPRGPQRPRKSKSKALVNESTMIEDEPAEESVNATEQEDEPPNEEITYEQAAGHRNNVQSEPTAYGEPAGHRNNVQPEPAAYEEPTAHRNDPQPQHNTYYDVTAQRNNVTQSQQQHGYYDTTSQHRNDIQPAQNAYVDTTPQQLDAESASNSYMDATVPDQRTTAQQEHNSYMSSEPYNRYNSPVYNRVSQGSESAYRPPPLSFQQQQPVQPVQQSATAVPAPNANSFEPSRMHINPYMARQSYSGMKSSSSSSPSALAVTRHSTSHEHRRQQQTPVPTPAMSYPPPPPAPQYSMQHQQQQQQQSTNTQYHTGLTFPQRMSSRSQSARYSYN